MLLDPSGQEIPFQFIQYRFSGAEHPVEAKPHGNATKFARPYKRTCPSTLNALREQVEKHPPKRAVFKVDQERGGILNATCEGDLPRNALQASRIRSKISHSSQVSNDPLQALVVKFKEQNGRKNQFI